MDNQSVIKDAHIVFVQISNLNIFKPHNTKKNMLNRYYSTVEVIHFLNTEDLHVCIVTQDDWVIEKNF